MREATPLAGFACAEEGNPYSAGEVRLAFGQRANGAIVHIAEVGSGLGCGCVCPACAARLVARKGRIRQAHFGHYRTGACLHAPESALHKLAKQVLSERRILRLPAIRAELDGEVLETRAECAYALDDAALEHRLGGVIPDVIARKGTRELLIEIAVAHACDAAKIVRIRALGLSAIEIDLSEMARDSSRRAVEDALVRSAPRRWLYNPLVDDARRALEAALRRRTTARQRARRVQARDIAAALERDPERAAPDDALIARVVADGYESAIDVAVGGDMGFKLARRHWQAWILDTFVLAPLRHSAPGFRTIVARHVLDAMRAADLLRPALAGFIDDATAAQVRAHVPEFQSPYRAIEAYLRRLEQAGLLVKLAFSWSISESARRAWETRRTKPPLPAIL